MQKAKAPRVTGRFGKKLMYEFLERVAQGELNQARGTHRRNDLPERAGILYIINRGIGEVRVIPDVEKVRREPDILTLGDLEVLDEREVPVLLIRSTVDVAAQIAKRSDRAVAPVCCASANPYYCSSGTNCYGERGCR